MYLIDNKYFYRIPKTAGTAISCSLPNNSWATDVLSPLIRDIGKGVVHNPIWWWEAQTGIRCTSENTTSLVRNPYSRAASYWLYYNRKYNPIPFYDFLAKDNALDTYFANCEIDTKTTMTYHLTGQNGRINTNIMRYETDIPKLMSLLGIEHLNRHNASIYVTDYKNYYSTTTIDIVKDRYKEDFENFNYSQDINNASEI